MSKILDIKAREILDSKGKATVEVDLKTESGVFRASCPSGVSTGKYEAVEIDTEQAVWNVNNKILHELGGRDPRNQEELDLKMIKLDGSLDKSRLGVNAILPVSIAICRAGAMAKKMILHEHISDLFKADKKKDMPYPCILMIEGGLHSGSSLDIQEFMIVPKGKSFEEKLETGVEIYKTLGKILEKKYGKISTNVGIEGGYAPNLKSTYEALDLIVQAAGMNKIEIVLDVAASHFYTNGKYDFEDNVFTKAQLLGFYQSLIKRYPITGIEDPFAEQDWEGFAMITKSLGKKISIIGDDLLTTNIKRIQKAVSEKACNGLILKPNQIGTVTETLEAAKKGFDSGWQVFVKHRGGETNDNFISDLAVGIDAKYIMAGAPARGERLAKYNRLLRIEQE